MTPHPEFDEEYIPPLLRRKRREIMVYLVPVLLIGGMTLTYLLEPEFYLRYILQEKEREFQVAEIITFLSALIGGALLLVSAWRLRRLEPQRGFIAKSGAVTIGVIGLAAVFFAGEEISWGQHYFGWRTPESYRELAVETNLHNTDIPVQAMGSGFLIVMFLLLPLVWRLRRPMNWRLPESLAPAIAEGPVILTVALAFAWKECKTLVRIIWTETEREQSDLYMQFIEQFNEHKEMLVAVALLMYGVYRVRAARAWIARAK